MPPPTYPRVHKPITQRIRPLPKLTLEIPIELISQPEPIPSARQNIAAELRDVQERLTGFQAMVRSLEKDGFLEEVDEVGRAMEGQGVQYFRDALWILNLLREIEECKESRRMSGCTREEETKDELRKAKDMFPDDVVTVEFLDGKWREYVRVAGAMEFALMWRLFEGDGEERVFREIVG